MTTLKLSPNALGSGQFTIAAPNSNNTRTMTLADSSGTIYIAPGDGIQALAGGIPAARTITAGTGVSVSNGDGVAGNPTITNSGVTSNVAGTGISVSGATGAVTITNSGVTSITASTGISASASTGGVTLTNSGVTSIVAGSNITISGGTGAVTISASSGASTTYGAVGTYTIAAFQAAANTTYAQGATIAGSSLQYASDAGNNSAYVQFFGSIFQPPCGSMSYGSPFGVTNAGLSGTWQFMSRVRNAFGGSAQMLPALLVRIA